LRANGAESSPSTEAGSQRAIDARDRERRDELGTEPRIRVCGAKEGGERVRRRSIGAVETRAVPNRDAVVERPVIVDDLPGDGRGGLRGSWPALLLCRHGFEDHLGVEVVALLAERGEELAERRRGMHRDRVILAGAAKTHALRDRDVELEQRRAQSES